MRMQPATSAHLRWVHSSMPEQVLSSDIGKPILLALLAGLSTTIGAVLAVVHAPDARHMAVLLGFAIGVMATISIVELIVKNAMEHDTFMVLACTTLGGMAYYMLEPLLPKTDIHHHDSKFDKDPGHPAADEEDPEGRGTNLTQRKISQAKATGSASCDIQPREPTRQTQLPDNSNGLNSLAAQGEHHSDMTSASKSALLAKSHMLRLGLLMAITMTLHNLPEGFAVAFSALTPLGPIMALAIAMHNIPEGVIIAAPIFAATGNRWKAVGLATASGLSEPLGAVGAMLLLRPFLNAERLQYVLAGTGGLMLAVCGIELWPEARECKNDRGLALGIIAGSLVMLFTLIAEASHEAQHVHLQPV